MEQFWVHKLMPDIAYFDALKLLRILPRDYKKKFNVLNSV